MTLDLERPWNDYDIVVIDVESTGVDDDAKIVEVAAVRFRAGEIVDRFAALVNPGCPIPAEATAVHGITDAMVADALPLEAHAASLIRVADGAVPCAYNALYDRGLLHRQITGNDCPAIDPAVEWIDPLVIIRKVDRYRRGSGRHKLAAACKRWGVDLEQQHRALGDATAAGLLLFRLLERGVVKPTPLGRILDYMRKQREAQDAESATFRARNEEQRRHMQRLDIARCWNAASALVAFMAYQNALGEHEEYLDRIHKSLGLSGYNLDVSQTNAFDAIDELQRERDELRKAKSVLLGSFGDKGGA